VKERSLKAVDKARRSGSRVYFTRRNTEPSLKVRAPVGVCFATPAGEIVPVANYRSRETADMVVDAYVASGAKAVRK